jgi:hypothetical protein
MAGQREGRFRSTSSVAPITIDPSATVRTTVGPSVRPSKVQASEFDTLSTALSGFFGQSVGFIQKMDEIQHQENLVRIRRENEALATQGQADRLNGQSQNPEAAQRYDYVTAYTKTDAHLNAKQLAERLKDETATQSLDGSFDIDQATEALLKQEFGAGSGDADYDAAFLSSFKQMSDPYRSSFKSAVIDTTKANTVDALQTEVAGILSDQSGRGLTRLPDLIQRMSATFQGDTGKAKKLLSTSLTANIQNPGQAETALSALRITGFQDTYPDLYNAVTDDVYKRVQSVTSYEASKAYTNHETKVTAMLASGAWSPEDIMQTTTDIMDTFRRLGGGNAAFGLIGRMNSVAMRSAEKKASENSVINAYYGKHGGVGDLTKVAPVDGKTTQEALNKDYDPAIHQLLTVDLKGTYPALAETARNGFVFPLESDQTAGEFATFLANDRTRQSSAGLLSDTYKRDISLALKNPSDPVKSARALGLLKTVEKAVGPDLIGHYLDDGAKGLYEAAKRYGGTDPQNFFKTLAEHPEDRDLFKERELPWGRLLSSSKKPSELDVEVNKKLNDQIKADLDRKGFLGFGGYGISIGNGALADQMRLGVAQQLSIQKRLGGKTDLDQAINATTSEFKNRVVALPGLNKNLVVYEDPFTGRGRALSAPISVVKGSAVYAPFPLKNALGEVEDPVETFRTDLGELRKAFPGLVSGEKDFAVEPQLVKRDGLWTVTNGQGQPLYLGPGQKFVGVVTADNAGALSVGEAIKQTAKMLTNGLRPVTEPTVERALEIPGDVVQANDFINARLPTGFYTEQVDLGGRTAWQVVYGFRLKVGQKEADVKLQERTSQYVNPADVRRPADRNFDGNFNDGN